MPIYNTVPLYNHPWPVSISPHQHGWLMPCCIMSCLIGS